MAEREQQASTPAASGINVQRVLWGGTAIALGTVLAALASYFLWRWWSPSPAVQPGGAAVGTVPAPPRLESAPQLEREQYFAGKQRMLQSREWIDRQRGIARIPVEEAMQIMAARSAERERKEQP